MPCYASVTNYCYQPNIVRIKKQKQNSKTSKYLLVVKIHLNKKRMHSSRMRTGRSLIVCRSLLLRGGPGSDPLNFSLGFVPGSDPPQFPPWVWAWT